jgi:hypothetical protein
LARDTVTTDTLNSTPNSILISSTTDFILNTVRSPPSNLNPGDAGVLGVDLSSVSTSINYQREENLLALLGSHVWTPENQAALNFANGRHQNLAHFCVQLGYSQLLLVLIEQGINIHAKDVNGWIPLDFARLHGDEEAADVLEGGWVECGQHPCPTHVSLNPTVVPKLSSDCKMDPQGSPSEYCVAARNLDGTNIPFSAHQVVYNASQNSPHNVPTDFERPTGGSSHQYHLPHPGATPGQLSGPRVNAEPVKPLITTKNRWTPRRCLRINKNSLEYTDRQVKSLLNKLTLEKFDAISTQILEWANHSVNETDARTLFHVTVLVFKSATDDILLSEMYACLCRFLMERISPHVRHDSICNNKDGKPIAGGNLFRNYLLNRCQDDFERGWSVKEPAANKVAAKIAGDGEKDLRSDEYCAAQNARRRGLGLIKFMGELFKWRMLTERIMHDCIKKLLSNVENPEEEEIESLYMLLATVGLTLDNVKARCHMDIYFSRMKELASGGKISSRVQFMILVCKAVHFHCLSPYLFAGHNRTSIS